MKATQRVSKNSLSTELRNVKDRIVTVMMMTPLQVRTMFFEQYPKDKQTIKIDDMRRRLMLASVYRMGLIFNLPDFV